MWIKAQDGKYLNTDYMTAIYAVKDSSTYCRMTDDWSYDISRTEDLRETIIQNIISGTKLMEVQ